MNISSGENLFPKSNKEELSWLITLSTQKSPNKFRKFCDKYTCINTEGILLLYGSNLSYWNQGFFYEGEIVSGIVIGIRG